MDCFYEIKGERGDSIYFLILNKKIQDKTSKTVFLDPFYLDGTGSSIWILKPLITKETNRKSAFFQSAAELFRVNKIQCLFSSHSKKFRQAWIRICYSFGSGETTRI